MKKLVFLVLLTITLTSVGTFAQIIKIDKVNCKVPEADLITIEKIARFEKELYNNLFNTHANDSLFVKVTIMSAAQYKDVQRNHSGLHKTVGFYTPQLDESFVLKRPEYLSTVIHEMSHCFLRHNLLNPPRWLNEGIAEFCGTMVIEGDKVSYSPDARRIKSVRNMVIGSPIRLEKHMKLTNSDWSNLDVRSNLYSISYAVIYFLIKKNPSILKQILLYMKEGQTAINAIEYSYGGFKRFESDFNAFYRNTAIKPF